MFNATPADTSTYDLVPYPSHPFPQSHPDNLATIAKLFGLNPAPIENCRVLELGCASGGNLIPMADCFPNSSFEGVDGSQRQIATGRKVIEGAGLCNVKLHATNILELGAELGHFDYIVCHGVYSWVPTNVQAKIMEICKSNLNPRGVAYVSYNTYPGWHMRGIIRDFMCYHAAKFADANVRVSQARALLDFLAKSLADQNHSFATLLKEEVGAMQGQADSYLYHDHMEEVNDPVYFHQFAERARAKGLQYLGESHLSSMFTGAFPQHIEQTLRFLATDTLQVEQYMDFLRNRMFRQTLLVHDGFPISRMLNASCLERLFVSTHCRRDESFQEQSPGEERFSFPNGISISTSESLVKAALHHLNDSWPRAVFFPSLVAACEGHSNLLSRTQRTDEIAEPRNILAEMLLQGYMAGSVQLHSNQLSVTNVASSYPTVSRLTQFQAKAGDTVVNRKHQIMQVDATDRKILELLNGKNDHASVVSHLLNDVNNKKLQISSNGEPIDDNGKVRDILESTVTNAFRRFVNSALLIDPGPSNLS